MYIQIYTDINNQQTYMGPNRIAVEEGQLADEAAELLGNVAGMVVAPAW